MKAYCPFPNKPSQRSPANLHREYRTRDRESRGRRPPCGAYLQYIYDFSDGELTVIMEKAKEWKILPKSIERKTIEEILPYRFEPKKGLFQKS